MKTLSLFLFFFCIFPTHLSAENIATPVNTTIEKRGLFSTMDSIQNQKVQITELQGAIILQEQNIEKLSQSIDTVVQDYERLNHLESQILESPIYLSGSMSPEVEKTFLAVLINLSHILQLEPTDIPKTFVSYESQKYQFKEKYSLNLEEKKAKQQTLKKNLGEYNAKLEFAQSELLRQEKLLNELYKTLVKNLATLFTVLIGIFIFSQLIQWGIRSRPKFSDDQKSVLTNFVKWISNIAIIGVVAVFFFSELLSFLPFLAILGTAIGFALRDIISSFIAWFLIGHKDSVYKLGDVIEVEGDNVFGRVFKISPVVTTIQELGLSGPSGMYKSFPNKAIFEKSIKNISKINNWVYITIDFLLETSSSIPKSKIALLSAMNEVVANEKYSSPLNARAPFRKYGIQELGMHPQIFLDIKPQGIFLRGKVFVYWAERHEIRSEIVEAFFELAQKDKSIIVRQIEIG